MQPRRQVYELHAELSRVLGPTHAWALLQLLRTAAGNEPFPGPSVGPAELFGLHAALAHHLSPGSAWYVVELLREHHDSRLPDGTPWPDAIRPDPEG
jgi:hypothetical protein